MREGSQIFYNFNTSNLMSFIEFNLLNIDKLQRKDFMKSPVDSSFIYYFFNHNITIYTDENLIQFIFPFEMYIT